MPSARVSMYRIREVLRLSAAGLPAMKPLPATPYEYALWKRAGVGVDYHIEVERHYYSVPHTLVGHDVEVRLSATTVECFFNARRIAVHARSYQIGKHTTIPPEHMPKAHQKHAEWSPSRLIRWAGTIGPSTQAVVTYQLTHKPHPEQGSTAVTASPSRAPRCGISKSRGSVHPWVNSRSPLLRLPMKLLSGITVQKA